MKKRQVIIIGAGISGLSVAWYLSRSGHPLDIAVLDKSARAGGWIHTDRTAGFHFEKGPRAFRADTCPALLRLSKELELEDQLIWSHSKPHHRYLWLNGELHRFPTNPFSFCISPLTRGFVSALFSEWKKPTKAGDETVWEFVLRRFNYDVARLFFDPLVVGIFGGNIREISVRACFPVLKRWEEQYGCLTKGLLHYWKEKRKCSKYSADVPALPLSAIFSFKEGVEQLSQTLVKKTDATYHFNGEVQRIALKDNGIEVMTKDRIFYADTLFCTLPIRETAQLFEPLVPHVAREFLKVSSEGIGVVSLGYDYAVLPIRGFGYLTPTYAHEDILGVVFDSSVFPQHNRHGFETRLTIKLGDRGRDEAWHVDAALHSIRKHLGISHTPSAISFKRAARAIPQYGVCHLEKMAALKEELQKQLPCCFLAGNYLTGVSVDHCIQRAKETVDEAAAKWVKYTQ